MIGLADSFHLGQEPQPLLRKRQRQTPAPVCKCDGLQLGAPTTIHHIEDPYTIRPVRCLPNIERCVCSYLRPKFSLSSLAFVLAWFSCYRFAANYVPKALLTIDTDQFMAFLKRELVLIQSFAAVLISLPPYSGGVVKAPISGTGELHFRQLRWVVA